MLFRSKISLFLSHPYPTLLKCSVSLQRLNQTPPLLSTILVIISIISPAQRAFTFTPIAQSPQRRLSDDFTKYAYVIAFLRTSHSCDHIVIKSRIFTIPMRLHMIWSFHFSLSSFSDILQPTHSTNHTSMSFKIQAPSYFNAVAWQFVSPVSILS